MELFQLEKTSKIIEILKMSQEMAVGSIGLGKAGTFVA